MQAKLFSDKLEQALARYEARQLTSAQVIARLVEVAQELREARHRHEALGLSVEEIAFYDALAEGTEDWVVDPQLAEIARALVAGIKAGSVSRLGRSRVDRGDDPNEDQAPTAPLQVQANPQRRWSWPGTKGDRGLILDQARELYRFWPETPLSDAIP